MDDEVVEMHAIVRGRVQGVGFRWTVSHHANSLGIKGNVRNMPDGNVEIHAQGERDLLEDLLGLLRSEVGAARVESIKATYSKPAKQYSQFSIVK